MRVSKFSDMIPAVVTLAVFTGALVLFPRKGLFVYPVPAYIVFSNAAQTDMAARQPGDLDEFLDVSGVGRFKAEKYGERFLAAIATWRAQAER